MESQTAREKYSMFYLDYCPLLFVDTNSTKVNWISNSLCFKQFTVLDDFRKKSGKPGTTGQGWSCLSQSFWPCVMRMWNLLTGWTHIQSTCYASQSSSCLLAGCSLAHRICFLSIEVPREIVLVWICFRCWSFIELAGKKTFLFLKLLTGAGYTGSPRIPVTSPLCLRILTGVSGRLAGRTNANA